MTEEEWLACSSPVAMLHFLNADAYKRKSLLYAVAVCMRQPGLLTEELHIWLDVVEGVIRGQLTKDDLDRHQEDAEYEVSRLVEGGWTGTRAQYMAIADVIFCTWATESMEYEPDDPIPPAEAIPALRAHAAFVRDIFGNPFRPANFDPAWRTDTAVALARTMYKSCEFSAMPILADALQDAGCDNDDILNHCRDTTATHVRGCWVVDLVLGKE